MNIKALKRWLPLLLIVLLIAAAWASGLADMINLDMIKAHRQDLLDMVDAHPVLSLGGFIVLYTAAVALSLPFATLMTLLGGFLFGRWLGTAAVVIGATAGAAVLFLVARSALGTSLRDRAGPLYQKVAANMQDNAIGYMLFMRLVPLFPFFLVNIVPALFNVRLAPYVITTFFGIIPGTFVYVNFGRELASIETLHDLASPQMLLAFTLLGLFALIPVVYTKIKKWRGSASIALAALLLFSQNVDARESYDRFLGLYDGLLQAHIHPAEKGGIIYSGVDYPAWSADPRHKQALGLLLSQNPPDHGPANQKMAFWINTYNFLTIELIVREGEDESIKNLGGIFASPWRRHAWTLGGKDYTLDYIEHKILRQMGDARVHFAINCASVSCPDLRGEAYRAEKLDAQLDEQTRIFLRNPGKGVRQEMGALYVSKNFDWYAKDFSNGNVRGWLKNYMDAGKITAIAYMEYDWSLNKAEQE